MFGTIKKSATVRNKLHTLPIPVSSVIILTFNLDLFHAQASFPIFVAIDLPDAVQSRKDVIELFSDKRAYAQEIERGIGMIKANFDRYVDLAQGQYDIAVNFIVALKDDKVVIVDNDIHYHCSNGNSHLVISREMYRATEMGKLLDADEPIPAAS